MTKHLEDLKRLYTSVPAFEEGTISDLRKILDEYISIFVNISTQDDYKHATVALTEGFEDIDILISGSMEANTKEEKENFYTGASKRLKGDIKALIKIIN